MLIEHIHRLISVPLLLPLLFSTQRQIIEADVRRWNGILRNDGLLALLRLRSFRTLYFYRLARGNLIGHGLAWLLARVYRGEASLHLDTLEIGPGLFVHPGIATIVAARHVGADCWIGTDVTIGFRDDLACPVLEDGVVVSDGAKVIGGIVVGAGATVEPNAVVIRDVPPCHVAVGAPARLSPS